MKPASYSRLDTGPHEDPLAQAFHVRAFFGPNSDAVKETEARKAGVQLPKSLKAFKDFKQADTLDLTP